MAYQITDIERHWNNNQAILRTNFRDWLSIFHDLVPMAMDMAASLADGER
jgi:hypothetical protein